MTESRVEARAWLERGGEPFGGDGFVSHHDFATFVDELYGAGAVIVEVVKNTLVVTMPLEPEVRARVIAIYNREVDQFGEEFGGEETAGHEMSRDEAIAMGHPEAEGEWVLEDLHVIDRGQATITFWWD